MTNIFVRNLDPTTTEAQLRDLFAPHGSVQSVTIVTGRDTNGPRGMAFIEMAEAAGAQAAITALNGFLWNQRELSVNEARPKKDHESGRHVPRASPPQDLKIACRICAVLIS